MIKTFKVCVILMLGILVSNNNNLFSQDTNVFETIKDLELSESYGSNIKLNNVRSLGVDIGVTTTFYLLDKNNDIIKYSNGNGKLEKGDYYEVIGGKYSQSDGKNNSTKLGYIFSNENITRSEVPSKDYLAVIPVILTGENSDQNTNRKYVRIAGKIIKGYNDKCLQIDPASREKEYLIYHDYLNDDRYFKNPPKIGENYVVIGMVDNTLLSDRAGDYVNKTPILILDYWSVEDNDKTWKIGVYNENEGGGSCSIGNVKDADSDGIIWTSVKDGENITLTASPNSGYEVRWTLNGEEISNSNTFTTQVIADAVYRVMFVKTQTVETFYNITVSSSDQSQGEVQIIADDETTQAVTVTKQFKENQTIKIEALPEEGYKFDYWLTGSEKIQINPYELTVSGEGTYTAYFQKDDTGSTDPDEGDNGGESGEGKDPTDPKDPDDPEQPGDNKDQEYKLTIKVGAHGTMTVTNASGNILENGAMVKKGTKISVTLTPDANYLVEELRVDDSPVELSKDNTYEMEVNKDVTLTATFYVDINGRYELKVAVSEPLEGLPMGKVYIDREGQTVVSAKYQEEHVFYAVPFDGCIFEGWRDAGSDYVRKGATFDGSSYSFEWNGISDENLVALFDYKIQFPRTITIKAGDSSKGTVQIEGEDGLTVKCRRYLKIKATPKSEYNFFVSWTDQNNKVVSTEPEYIYTGEDDVVLTANFVTRYPVSLTNTGDGKLIMITGDKTPIENGSYIDENSDITFLTDEVGDNMEISLFTINGKDLTKDITDGNGELTVKLTEPIVAEAFWDLKQYKLSIIFSKGGEILVYSKVTESGKGDGIRYETEQKVSHGSELHIFCVPDEGYELEQIIINGLDKTSDVKDSYLIHTATDHTKIEGSFSEVTSALGSVIDDYAGKTDIRIYDLQGRRMKESIENLRPGIYIIVDGETTKKIKI